MVTSGNDQSATVRCGKHGRTTGGVFFHPEPYERVAADYLCLRCWVDAGTPLQLSKEDFLQLRYRDGK